MFIPVCAIMGIGMLKEWIADSKRKKQDKIVNAIPVKRVKNVKKSSDLN